MNTRILHELPSDAIPESVRAVDMVLNHRVATALTPAELDASLRQKLDIKRYLLAAPPALLDDRARAVLARIDGWV